MQLEKDTTITGNSGFWYQHRSLHADASWRRRSTGQHSKTASTASKASRRRRGLDNGQAQTVSMLHASARFYTTYRTSSSLAVHVDRHRQRRPLRLIDTRPDLRATSAAPSIIARNKAKATAENTAQAFEVIESGLKSGVEPAQRFAWNAQRDTTQQKRGQQQKRPHG